MDDHMKELHDSEKNLLDKYGELLDIDECVIVFKRKGKDILESKCHKT